VLIDGQRVVAVQAGAQPPPGAQGVDLGAATLLPGLIDTHLHLAFDASDDPVGRLAGAGDVEVHGWMRVAARSCLDPAITTVRDLGDRGYLALRLRDEFASDLTTGPHVVAAEPPITTPGIYRISHPSQGPASGRGPIGLLATEPDARCAGRRAPRRQSAYVGAKIRERQRQSGVRVIAAKARLTCPGRLTGSCPWAASPGR
jgi:imidazolonepropionase-like amidohydrolase